MPFKQPNYLATLNTALATYQAGLDPALIELPERAVFPRLIHAAPATARKSRVTGILLGMPAPRYIRRGRSIRYRLKDVLDWLVSAQDFGSSAEEAMRRHGKMQESHS
ncbi:hypothetical protein [Onishia taeanensis]